MIVGHYINGERYDFEGGYAPVYNPATGLETKKVALANKPDVEKAITAASNAFISWKESTPATRSKIFFKFKQLLDENADQLAAQITDEHGKVLDDAMGELRRGIEVVEYACGIAEMLKGEHSRNVGPAIDGWSEHHPLGVVAGITPFNFPAMVPMWMFPMAIACGNAFILKPSERDPSISLFIAELFKKAGLPDGVFNVVNGGKKAVDTLLTDVRVKAVSFVGSTQIAQYVYRTGTSQGKRVQALGGAKNHAVVMPDADINSTVTALMGAAYGSCGERCMAISVVVCVGDDIAEKIVKELGSAALNVNVGPGQNADSDMGPLITQAHQHKVKNYIDIGIDEGAKLIVDGRNLKVEKHEGGFFLGPSLFDHVTPHMQICREEIFGPVLCVVRVKDLHEAISIINEHEYGNGTCIFTQDGSAAHYFSQQIQVGMVGINVPLPVPMAYHSFGGWKNSLFGDLHAYGPDSIRFYTKRKQVIQKWPAGSVSKKVQYAFPSASS